MSQKVKPAFKMEIFPVAGAIWQNGTFYNVTFEKAYKPEDSDQWQSCQSFGRDDLLKLAKVADHCHTWILKQEQTAREAAKEQTD